MQRAKETDKQGWKVYKMSWWSNILTHEGHWCWHSIVDGGELQKYLMDFIL